MPAALPAVTLPPSRKAGRSRASASAVVVGRGCSSRATSRTVPDASVASTGTISATKRPAASAAAQRACERSAQASCSSRVTVKRSATFSPVSPIDSLPTRAARTGFTNRQPSVVS